MVSLETALWSVLHARTLLLGAIAFLFFAYVFRKPDPKNCPPGPPRLPILGNLFQMGIKQPHLEVQQVGSRGKVIGWHPVLDPKGQVISGPLVGTGADANKARKLVTHWESGLCCMIPSLSSDVIILRGY